MRFVPANIAHNISPFPLFFLVCLCSRRGNLRKDSGVIERMLLFVFRTFSRFRFVVVRDVDVSSLPSYRDIFSKLGLL